MKIEVKGFADLDATNHYNGVYANFSLLHARKTDMPDHLRSIGQSLKSGGLLHIGMKTGTGEHRDRLGRFYAYYEDAELTGLLANVGLTVISRATGSDVGLAGSDDPWIIMRATKND